MSRPLARASALILLAARLSAQDLGAKVEFPAFEAEDVYDSGESASISESWDTLLFHGTASEERTGFQVSRLTDKGWSEWIPARVSRKPSGRFWAKASFPKPAPGAVRLRADTRGAVIYNAEAFASGDGEARTSGQSAPPPAAPASGAVARTSWGAHPPKADYTPDSYVKITLHHTDGPQTTTLERSKQEVLFIQEFHQNGRGWNDIAYHFLVDGAGNVFEGRPEGTLGAHTKNNNTGNLGIAMLGTHHPPKDDPVTKAKEDAVGALGRYAVEKYGIDPNSLKGHRDYKSTDCPGDLGYARLRALKEAFARKPPAPPPAAAKEKKRLKTLARPAFE
jgi:hypothetical protein